MKNHLARQSGVQSVEVNLIDGKIQIVPKEDGRIDPPHLLKAVYDSGVSVAEMDITARGKIVKDALGNLLLNVNPNQTFVIAPNSLAKELEQPADFRRRSPFAASYTKSQKEKRDRSRIWLLR